MLSVVCGIFLSSLGTNGATLCDDKSTSACQRLAAVKPDMCQDNCTASLCPKTCGKCPLTCYSCDYIDHPSNCNQTTVCNDASMLCISSQTVSGSLEKSYLMGCVTNKTCKTLYGSFPNRSSSAVRRDVDLLGGCCASDLCNKYDEPDKVPITTHPTVQATTKDASPRCQQIDDEVCNHMKIDVGCNDACVSTMCPRTCGMCSRTCFYCLNTNHPANCTQRITCDEHEEVCFTIERNRGGNQTGYQLSCINNRACPHLLSMGVDGTCCRSDFCNGYYSPKMSTTTTTTTTPTTTTPPPTTTTTTTTTTTPPPTTTTTTTTPPPTTTTVKQTTLTTQSTNLGLPTGCQPTIFKTGDCPIGFTKRGHSCYYIGRNRTTHQEAKAECHKLCSRLAIISNAHENSDVTKFLTHLKQLIGRDEVSYYWLDGFYYGGKWRWNSTAINLGGKVYTHWKPGSPEHLNGGARDCIELGKGESVDNHHHHHWGYFWNNRDCNRQFNALCEYPLTASTP